MITHVLLHVTLNDDDFTVLLMIMMMKERLSVCDTKVAGFKFEVEPVRMCNNLINEVSHSSLCNMVYCVFKLSLLCSFYHCMPAATLTSSDVNLVKWSYNRQKTFMHQVGRYQVDLLSHLK